jgi:hypothetical protein
LLVGVLLAGRCPWLVCSHKTDASKLARIGSLRPLSGLRRARRRAATISPSQGRPNGQNLALQSQIFMETVGIEPTQCSRRLDVVNAADELDAMLADLAERVQDIRDFQCQHGYECTATRNPPKRMIALAKHWRSEIAARRGTLSDAVVATPPHSGLARQTQQVHRLSKGATSASQSSGRRQARPRAASTGR